MRIHKKLATGRWFEFSLLEQLANVGMDIERAIRWKQKGDNTLSNQAFERALDLLDLTVADPKHKGRLKEILRTRELLIDYFVYDNQYQSSDQLWTNYFYPFNYAVALRKER